MSILDCDPSDIDMDPSEGDKGGVSTPELIDVQVLEREREAGPGLENTGTEETRERISYRESIGNE
jgi:hypothetical protein